MLNFYLAQIHTININQIAMQEPPHFLSNGRGVVEQSHQLLHNFRVLFDSSAAQCALEHNARGIGQIIALVEFPRLVELLFHEVEHDEAVRWSHHAPAIILLCDLQPYKHDH